MRILALICLLLAGCGPGPDKKTIRVAVIGGMVMSGMWTELSQRFEAETGYRIEVTASGPKEIIGPAFREGVADLLTMHSSDVATDLVAAGFAHNMRPWTRNELVILAPPADPAGIVGWRDGAAALQRIAETGSRFVDAKGAGKRIIAEKLWHKAGIRPTGDWILPDQSRNAADLLAYAERENAYVLSGRIPVLFGKLPAGGMNIAVQGDPDMQRPYVVIEANPKMFPQANTAGARVLADFLTGPDGQKFLRDFAAKQPSGIPLFFPLQS